MATLHRDSGSCKTKCFAPYRNATTHESTLVSYQVLIGLLFKGYCPYLTVVYSVTTTNGFTPTTVTAAVKEDKL